MLVLLDLGLCANHNVSLTRAVSLLDALCAVNCCGGGEVGALDVLHQLLESALGVVDAADGSVNYLCQVMSGNICRHTYGDTDSAVYKQVRELRGKNRRLCQLVIEVGHEVNDLLLDVAHHVVRNLGHSRLGVTVSSRTVAVNRAKVTLTVNENVTHGELLRESYHCAVNGSVTVRMVATKHVTYRRRGLAVRLVIGQIILVHSVKNSSLTGLHAVAGVGQSTAHDYAHGVLDKGFLYLFFNVNIYNFLILEHYILFGIFVILCHFITLP